MLSVLEIEDGMRRQPLSVPGTDFVLRPFSLCPSWRIFRAGEFDADLTSAMLRRFGGERGNARTLRRIAGWLREGAPH